MVVGFVVLGWNTDRVDGMLVFGLWGVRPISSCVPRLFTVADHIITAHLPPFVPLIRSELPDVITLNHRLDMWLVLLGSWTAFEFSWR